MTEAVFIWQQCLPGQWERGRSAKGKHCFFLRKDMWYSCLHSKERSGWVTGAGQNICFVFPRLLTAKQSYSGGFCKSCSHFKQCFCQVFHFLLIRLLLISKIHDFRKKVINVCHYLHSFTLPFFFVCLFSHQALKYPFKNFVRISAGDKSRKISFMNKWMVSLRRELHMLLPYFFPPPLTLGFQM